MRGRRARPLRRHPAALPLRPPWFRVLAQVRLRQPRQLFQPRLEGIVHVSSRPGRLSDMLRGASASARAPGAPAGEFEHGQQQSS